MKFSFPMPGGGSGVALFSKLVRTKDLRQMQSEDTRSTKPKLTVSAAMCAARVAVGWAARVCGYAPGMTVYWHVHYPLYVAICSHQLDVICTIEYIYIYSSYVVHPERQTNACTSMRSNITTPVLPPPLHATRTCTKNQICPRHRHFKTNRYETIKCGGF